MHDVAQQGAVLMAKNPAEAAEKFLEAHRLAVELRDRVHAGALAMLMARAHFRHGGFSRALAWARTAVTHDPQHADHSVALGQFYRTLGVQRLSVGKGQSAVTLLRAAQIAMTNAVGLEAGVYPRKTLEAILGDVTRSLARAACIAK